MLGKVRNLSFKKQKKKKSNVSFPSETQTEIQNASAFKWKNKFLNFKFWLFQLSLGNVRHVNVKLKTAMFVHTNLDKSTTPELKVT